MIDEYWDAVAVGSDLGLYVFFTQKRNKRPLCVRLPMVCLLTGLDRYEMC
jgi:hypothetical protein